jgi:hypothetical protein
MEEMWKSKIPLKVRNFVWLVYQGRIQTTDNLIWKPWKGDKKCKFCEEEEIVNHLLFLCPIASYMWCIIRDSMQWGQTPKSVRDFNDHFLLERGHKENVDGGLGPDLPRGRGKSIDGDLNIDDEGSKQYFEPLQSLHHCSIGYESVQYELTSPRRIIPASTIENTSKNEVDAI